MKKVSISLALALALAACGGVNSDLAAVVPDVGGQGTADDPVKKASPALAQFEAEVLMRLQQGNWITAIGSEERSCEASESADFCLKQWLQFADGARVSVNSAGNLYRPTSETVFSTVAISQEAPQPAEHSSACLQTAIEEARALKLELQHFDRLFTDTTVFLGYPDGQYASIELADGTCLSSWN